MSSVSEAALRALQSNAQRNLNALSKKRQRMGQTLNSEVLKSSLSDAAEEALESALERKEQFRSRQKKENARALQSLLHAPLHADCWQEFPPMQARDLC